MKFMNKFRSKTKQKSKDHGYNPRQDGAVQQPRWYPSGPDYTSRLDPKILTRIFSYVCPHATDKSYESSEESMIVDGCMLCDLRDLSNCTKVKKQWRGPAVDLLYSSIRIDAVHFCYLEEELIEARDRRSFRGRNAEPPDIPTMRLSLLTRTLWEQPGLGQRVQHFKLPYMTREICKSDLARCARVMPNIHYIDLPEGCYSGDRSCKHILDELVNGCSHIRKMKYLPGAEQLFEQLVRGQWSELEVLELSEVNIQPAVFRKVAGSLRYLSDLQVSDLPWFGDPIFGSSRGLPQFPLLTKLTLTNVPVTVEGLIHLLEDPQSRKALTSISLSGTDVSVPDLHKLLWQASELLNLSYTETVSMSLPLEPIPSLTSMSLETLNYEILSSSRNVQSLHPPATSYYNYLLTSVQSNSLPKLRTLYVRDTDFPEQLTITPPAPAFAQGSRNPQRQLNQPLEVYTKGVEEVEWLFTSVAPSDPFERRGSFAGGRPLSSYSAHKGLAPQWGNEARKSIIVGNGVGGFLTVEDTPRRPSSSGGFGTSPVGSLELPKRGSWFNPNHERRGSRADLWR